MRTDTDHSGTIQDAGTAAEFVTSDPQIRWLTAFLAKRLGHIFHLNRADVQDLEQSCWVNVLRAMQSFDPDRGKPFGLARAAANVWYCDNARSFRRRSARPDLLSFSEMDVEAGGIDFTELAGMRIDEEAALSALPADLADLARACRNHSMQEIAVRDGVHRGTVHRHIQILRDSLSELDPSLDPVV